MTSRRRRGALAAAAALAVGVVPALAATSAAAVPSTDTPVTYTQFGAVQDNGASSTGYFQPFWYDTDGRHIQAHGGQTVTVQEGGQTVHYWYGEDRSNGYWGSPGVAVYRSTDLLNWTNEGTAMRAVASRDELTQPYFDDLYGTLDELGQPDDERIDELNFHLNTTQAEDYTAIFERPKVLYNEANDEWVMWWHSDGRITPGGSTYARSFAAVAVADSPTGPFRMTGAYRLYNRANYQACTSSAVPGQARDMTVFQDSDGQAYISYSSEENYSLYIAKLNDDYTNVEHTVPTDTIGAHQYSEDGQFPYIFADGSPDAPVRGTDFQIVKECGHLEAPAIFRNGDSYHVLASGATGWAPNPQTYYTADDLLGTWIRGVETGDAYETVRYNEIPEGGDGLLSVGDVRKTTFGSQGTNVITLAPGKYVYMGDRWNEGKNDSTYVWLPLTIGENGRLEMHNPALEDPERWGDGWDESYWDDKGYGVGTWTVTEDGLVDSVARGTDAATILPATVTVDSAGTTRTTAVTWSELDTSRLGQQTITGTLDGDATFSDGRTFTRTIDVTATGISNVAPQAAVTASSRQSLAGTLIDGNFGKGWDDWTSTGYPRSSTLTFVWDSPRTLDSIAVHTFKDSGAASWPSDIAVQVRDLEGSWADSALAAQLLQDPTIEAPVALMDATALPEVTGVRLLLTSEANTWQAISEVEIWADTPPLNVCRAQGSTVAASFHQTEWDVMPASFACDGNAGTAWSTWSGTASPSPVTFTLTTAEAHLLDHVAFTNVEGTIASVGVEYRDAEGAWQPTSAQDVAPAANGTRTTVPFDAVTATGLRLTFATPGSFLKISEIVALEAVAPADTAALEGLLAQAAGLDREAYTAGSLEAVDAAVAAAEAVLAQEQPGQEEVDGAAAALAVALDSLVEVPAEAPVLTLSRTTVTAGETVDVTVTGLDAELTSVEIGIESAYRALATVDVVDGAASATVTVPADLEAGAHTLQARDGEGAVLAVAGITVLAAGGGEEPTDGEPTDGGPTDGGPTDGGPTTGGPTAGGPTAGAPSPSATGGTGATGSLSDTGVGTTALLASGVLLAAGATALVLRRRAAAE